MGEWDGESMERQYMNFKNRWIDGRKDEQEGRTDGVGMDTKAGRQYTIQEDTDTHKKVKKNMRD